MRKILSLTIHTGLLVILIISIILYVPAAFASTGSPRAMGEKDQPEQVGPPWLDPAWHYRRAVVISNSGATLPYYQVLIKLDMNNFDFSRTKPDGTDVRFTHSDGTTELKFWIESWDNPNRLAYVWVRVPSLAQGNTTIYLYYGNPDAISASDGNPTFDGFDDTWSQFSHEGLNEDAKNQIPPLSSEVYSPFVWIKISGTPIVSAGELTLINGTGIKSTTSYQNTAVGMRANYGSGGGNEWGGFINGASGQRTLIGDIPADPSNLYLSNYRTSLEAVLLPRVGGNDWHNVYHIYEVRWSLNESIGDVDHGVSTASDSLQVPNTAIPVTLYNNNSGANTTLKVDWVYVRQYQDPEPTVSVKAEQGLVELSIENYDYPDPVRKDAKLTYQLTIANTSSIDASGVVVTDTLPGNIQIGPISVSQGSCVPGSVILCDLNIIDANSVVSISIIITPTVNGVITNTAAVGSPGFELNLSDNNNIETTLVDSEPPVVNWVKPVTDGNIFFTFGGTILLETTATDNDQINRVEFWWFDGAVYNHIDTVTVPPYQAFFDTYLLNPEIPFWFEARAYDRAGNSNFPYNRSYIYIIRHNINYLPLVRR